MAHGLPVNEGEVAMRARWRRSRPAEAALPAGLRIEPVRTRPGLLDFAEVLAALWTPSAQAACDGPGAGPGSVT